MTDYKLWTNWSPEDEKLLLDIVLETLCAGGTRSTAFQKASEVLGRTESGTAFRWNTKLNKENEEMVRQAVAEGQKAKKRVVNKFKKGNKLYLSDVVAYIESVEKENELLLSENRVLRQELASN